MFEKEAKGYRNSNTNYYEYDDFSADDGEAIEEAYQKGAEFGYSEGKNEAKEIVNIAIEGIKHWSVVGGTERPFIKQAEMLFNLFLDKAEQFIGEVKK